MTESSTVSPPFVLVFETPPLSCSHKGRLSKVIVTAASVLASTFLRIPKARASTLPHGFTVGRKYLFSPTQDVSRNHTSSVFTKEAATLGPW